MELAHPDGRTLRVLQPAGDDRVHESVLYTAAHRDFGACPICGLDAPGTREHVPQSDLGGAVMTRTCARCNNQFGALHEPNLRDWYDGAIQDVYFTADGVQQGMKMRRVLVRETIDGQPVFLVDEDEARLAMTTMLRSGKFDMAYKHPDVRSVRALDAELLARWPV